MDFIKKMIYGAIVGVSNAIPGVSGGTMAVVLGIYDDLIASIARMREDFKKSLGFLIPIGLGAALGIYLLSSFIKFTITNYALPTNFFFLGLILGSVPMIYMSAQQEKGSRLTGIVAFVAALAVMLAISFLGQGEQSQQLMTSLTPVIITRLFVAGVVATAAMIIPGISGSFMFVLFGVYLSIITAISDLNIAILIPVALGALIGLWGGAKVIDWLFKNYGHATYLAILGLVVGSLVEIITQVKDGIGMNFQSYLGLAALIAGILISYLFSRSSIAKMREDETNSLEELKLEDSQN